VTEGIATILLFAVLMLMIATGLPLAFSIGFTSLLVAVTLWGPNALNIVATSTLGTMLGTLLLAIPLFVLMANFLQRSGIADDLYGLMYSSLGRIRGGLAVGTVIICTMFAAMAGISGAATVTMGLIALPSMLKRNYDKTIAIGSICAGGALGVLIPPSVAFIMYGLVSGVSVGKLFAGGMLPGLLLSSLFIIYILVRSHLNPKLGPELPPAERASLTAVLKQLKALILPLLLIIGVLGSIFAGIATPTEASAVGALGAIIATGICRKLNWTLVKDCCNETLKITAMILWIIVASTWLSTVYAAIGGPLFINELIESWSVSRWVILFGMQAVLIVLGMFMDTSGIIMITVPVFYHVIRMLAFDPLWFGVVFMMNMEMGFLTPPFGVNLFYMKGIVPEGVTMGDIYRSVVPFVLLQLTGLVIVILVPGIATLIPNLIFAR